MEIPYTLVIDNLTEFSVCYFKDKNHHAQAPPHFFVVIPIADARNLVISIITSKVEKRARFYDEKGQSSLVGVSPRNLCCLSKDSIVDCNQAEALSKRELLSRVDPTRGFRIGASGDQIDPSLKERILNAIKSSPNVKPYIKEYLKNR